MKIFNLIICLFSFNYLNFILSLAKKSVVFTAWNYYKENQFGPRIDNHLQYANQHNYEYIIFVHSHNIMGEVPPSNRPVKFIDLHQDSGWYGWLKVSAFKNAFEMFPEAELYFYIDMDCLFHNIMIPLEDFVYQKPQSIFLQLSGLGMPIIAPTMTQSQSILLRNTLQSKEFIKDWEETRSVCPNINLEQGAMYATIAYWYDGKNRNLFEKCYHICKHREEYSRPNGEYNMCYRHHMMKYNNTINNLSKDIYIFGYSTLPFYSPQNGFTLDASDWYPYLNTNKPGSKSCPLTIHRNKDFTLIYQTNQNNCSSNLNEKK